MQKNWWIGIVGVVVLGVAGVAAWLYLTPKTLTINEIGLTVKAPADLGNVTYKTNGPQSILIYSSAYEALNKNCKEHHIAELLLGDSPAFVPGSDIHISAHSDYNFAHVIIHPMGACAENSAQETALYDSAKHMLLP